MVTYDTEIWRRDGVCGMYKRGLLRQTATSLRGDHYGWLLQLYKTKQWLTATAVRGDCYSCNKRQLWLTATAMGGYSLEGGLLWLTTTAITEDCNNHKRGPLELSGTALSSYGWLSRIQEWFHCAYFWEVREFHITTLDWCITFSLHCSMLQIHMYAHSIHTETWFFFYIYVGIWCKGWRGVRLPLYSAQYS